VDTAREIARRIVASVFEDRLEESVSVAACATDAKLSGWDTRDLAKLPTTRQDVALPPTDAQLLQMIASGELPDSGRYRYTRSDASGTIVHERTFFTGTGWYYDGDYTMGSRYRGEQVRYSALAYVDTLVTDGHVSHCREGELRL